MDIRKDFTLCLMEGSLAIKTDCDDYMHWGWKTLVLDAKLQFD